MGYIYTMRWFKVRKEKWHCNTIQLPDYTAVFKTSMGHLPILL